MNATALSGSERTLRSDASVLGRVRRGKVIRLTVHVRSSQDPDGTGLRGLAVSVARNRVRERAHLTRDEYAKRFGATTADLQQVREFARRNGFRVIPDTVIRKTSANPLAHRTLELEGTVGAVNRAFGIELVRAREGRGREYRTYQGSLSLPNELAGVLQNVFGLDTRPQTRPHFRPYRSRGGYARHAATGGFTPTEIARMYKFPDGLTGQGQTIAVLELGGGFRRRDLRRYFHDLGMKTPHVSSVAVAGGGNFPTNNPDGDDGEVMLDLEVAGAVAPDARLVAYFARNTNRGFVRALNSAVHDNLHRPGIISISWGGPESTWTTADMQSIDEICQAAVTLGISVFVAAGDSGCTDGVAGTTPYVDFPASSPFVTACGGTRLTVNSDNTISESVWNDGPDSGTGGGISAVFSPPPEYQTGPGIVIPRSLDPSVGPGRGVPDVAGNADPETGYRVRVDGVNMVIGGTSAVAPLWAGLTARFNQALSQQVGFANTLLYSVVSAATGALRDVVDGNNDTTGELGGYNAGPGWDPCCGLGTPADAGKILDALRTA